MRILQVVHGFPPHEWAGTELTTFQLAKGLRARGHQVTVFTRTANPAALEFSVQEDRVEDVSVVRVVNNYTQTLNFSLQYDSPFFNRGFLRLLDQVQPQVVHFQHVQHLSARLLPLTASLGYPTVATLHDFFFPCPLINLIDTQGNLCSGPERGMRCASCLQGQASSEEARQRFLHMEKTLRAPDMILTPSTFLARKIISLFPFLEAKLRVAPLGIETVPRIKKTHTPGSPLRLLYVGVLLLHKGAHIFIDALNGLPADRFAASLYGVTVPARREYADRLREAARGLPVRFFDGYPHNQLGSILAQHDVLVMPMIGEETFSILTREALSAGLPVVAARRGALPEAVQNEVNGLLFEPENAADLQRCLTRLIDEPGLFEQLCVADSTILSVDDYVQNVEILYENLVTEAYGHKRGRAGKMSPMPVSTKEESVAITGPQARLSICIPTYNGAEFLAESIQSVLTQSFADFELLLVDDQSTDATLAIARSFNDPRLRVRQNERRLGIPGNWNRCLSLARGEYFCLFHQDDVMLPDNLEKKVRTLAMNPKIRFVHSAVEPLLEDSAPASLASWMERATEDFVVDGQLYFRKLLLRGQCICAPTVVTRRQWLLDLGGFDEELGYACDYEMWMKLCVEGHVAFLSQPLVLYRWHGQNASHAYRFARGVEEGLIAGRRALLYYLERTERSEEGAILSEALVALGELKHWTAELDQGKVWLEGQVHNWERTVKEQQRMLEEQQRMLEEQQAWIGELEKGKAWLEGQVHNWERTVKEQQRMLEEQQRMLEEQQAWIGELEKGKAWLEGQGRQLQAELQQYQENVWVRAGKLLGAVKRSEPAEQKSVFPKLQSQDKENER